VDLETLLRQSDFVSLHPFLDGASKHLIGEEQLRMMKKDAYLINASRGASAPRHHTSRADILCRMQVL
jgi:glyoxylate reductase